MPMDKQRFVALCLMSIDKALGAGECKYAAWKQGPTLEASHFLPGCVAGQFLAATGTDTDTLVTLDHANRTIDYFTGGSLPVLDELDSEQFEILKDLQSTWDGRALGAESKRAAMRQRVEEYEVKHGS